MKVFVIIYGLIGFVNMKEDPGRLMALMVDTHGMHMSDGMPAMQHYPEIGLYTENGKDLAFASIQGLAGNDVTLSPLVAGPVDFGTHLAAKEGDKRIIFVEDLTRANGGSGKVVAGCVGTQPADECVRGKHGLLGGRLDISGGIAVRPLDISFDNQTAMLKPTDPKKGDRWAFRSTVTGRSVGKANPYSNAVVLAGYFATDTPQLTISGQPAIDLKRTRQATCDNVVGAAGLGKTGEPCTVILVTNLPYHQESMAQVTRADQPVADHTELLFSLIADRSVEPLMMYRQTHTPTGSGNGPGGSCVGFFLASP